VLAYPVAGAVCAGLGYLVAWRQFGGRRIDVHVTVHRTGDPWPHR
jgi:hypothetical protein